MAQTGKEVVLVEGKLTKIVHQEGAGELPVKGQEIFALYRGTLQTGQEFDSNQDRDSPFNFVLGEGRVIKGWDEGFASMRKGQKATLICSPEYAYGARGSPPKIPANATLNFEVELIDFKDKKKQKWELSDVEKVQKATALKNSGNQHLKKGDFKAAVADYTEAIQCVESEQNADAKKILAVLQLNSAQAYIKTSQFKQAIDSCGKVLKEDPANVKALYRRGVAHLKSQDFELAKNDFKEVLKHDPENGEVKRELASVAVAAKEFKLKEKKVFGSIFSKGGLYEDKKPEAPKPVQKIESEEEEHEPIDEQKPKQQTPAEEAKEVSI